jgi:predicted dehydrogenase
VHVWCQTPVRPGFRVKQQPVPPGFNYDLWTGPAPLRTFPPFETPGHKEHVHFHWRWWWDYGGGVLADMACHFMDLPHWALGLRTPTTIASRGRITYKGDNEMPNLQQVDYEYPARGTQPPVHLTWYHGVRGPSLEDNVHHKGFNSGVLFEGEKASVVSDYSHHRLLPEGRDFQLPKRSIARSRGHHAEWLHAIRNSGTTTCNFDYSGALAEAVLLGNVAYRAGARIQYDGKTGRITNNKTAEQFLRREYRKGWTL